MFTGIILPLITPFKANGEVDEQTLLNMADGAIKAGAHGIFILGSQGQGPTMSKEERTKTTAKVVEHVNSRIPVIVHVGTTDLRSTTQLAVEAEAAGVDGIAVIAPYYYTDHSTAEIDAHFMGVAKATSLPMVMYNNAKYSGVNITVDWLVRLSEQIPTLCGVKLSYASPEMMLQYVERLPERVAVYSGSTMYLLTTVPFGVRGAINPLAVLFPELAVSIWNAINDKNWELAFKLQDKVNRASLGISKIFKQSGRSLYKEGLRMMGYNVEVFPRWEAMDLSEASLAELRHIMEIVSVRDIKN
jgi:dihydrodipicolinate synthase/N-acetylneuraminate lyase